MSTTPSCDYVFRSQQVLLCVAMQVCLLAGKASGLWLSLRESETKCVSEEIRSNVSAVVNYAIVFEDKRYDIPHTSVKVASPSGINLHHRKNITTGRFNFTATESGKYLACFCLDGHQHVDVGVSVKLVWRTGVGSMDWRSVARKEKIVGVELQLRKLEGAVEAIHENLVYLKGREAQMRIVSEGTNNSIAWFGIMSLGVCTIVSALQAWHLKCYFMKKKLV